MSNHLQVSDSDDLYNLFILIASRIMYILRYELGKFEKKCNCIAFIAHKTVHRTNKSSFYCPESFDILST